MRGCDVGTWLIVLGASCAFAATGCDGGLKCPPGTVKDGDTCRAATDTPLLDGVVIPDVGPLDPGTQGDGEDDAEPGDVDASGADTGTNDLPGTDNFPGGVIGRSCEKNDHCRNEVVPDGVCLGWEQSTYCTRLSCQEPGRACPEGALCMGITPKNPACAAACESHADCRADDGILCKLLPDLEGDLVGICHGVVSEPRGIGDPCIGPSDCDGAMGCLTNFEGGYCTMLRCGADEPCGDGAECIRVGGNPVCLKRCETGDDCVFVDGIVRACVELKSAVSGERIKVCGSSTSGVGLGEQCLNDTECKSNKCHVSFVGRCGDDGPGCMVDADCPLGVCVKSSEYSFGYCTQSCSVSVACAVPGLCVETVNAAGILEGECVPACGAEQTCRTEAGLTCWYGDPLLNPDRFACARLPAGAIGTPCRSNDDCRDGECLKAAGVETGACVKTGCIQGRCPFPTACEKQGDIYKCLVRCRSEADCPENQSCRMGLVTSVCVP